MIAVTQLDDVDPACFGLRSRTVTQASTPNAEGRELSYDGDRLIRASLWRPNAIVSLALVGQGVVHRMAKDGAWQREG